MSKKVSKKLSKKSKPSVIAKKGSKSINPRLLGVKRKSRRAIVFPEPTSFLYSFSDLTNSTLAKFSKTASETRVASLFRSLRDSMERNVNKSSRSEFYIFSTLLVASILLLVYYK